MITSKYELIIIRSVIVACVTVEKYSHKLVVTI